jgi:hypothetical protein
MLLVYCRGGDKTAVKVTRYAGLASGSRNDYVTYERPVMLDWNFKKQFNANRWTKYLRAIEQHKPTLAMVPDYFRPDEKLLMLRNIEQVKNAGAQHVMVCPKFAGAVADIPGHCLVAVSVPTVYAGFLPNRSELVGRKLHFLGGHPDQHLALMRSHYEGIEVFSIDANVLAMQAGHGKWWSAKRGDWIQTPIARQYSSIALAMHSARMIVNYLNDPKASYTLKRRVKLCLSETAEAA